MTQAPIEDHAIAEAAFYLWLEEGQPEGRDEAHWHQAREQLSAARPKPRTARKTAAAAKPRKTPAKKTAGAAAKKTTAAKTKAPTRKKPAATAG